VQTRQTLVDYQLWNRLHYGSATPTNGDPATRDILELGGSPAGIDFKYERPGGGNERSVEFLLPRLQVQSIEGVEPNTDGSPLKQTVTYKAYQPGSGSGLTVTLMNSVTDYAAV